MAKIGRPAKYDPSMCEKVIEMMKDGAALCEVCAELNISTQTLDRWRKEARKKEFSNAIMQGIALSKAWWTNQGRIHLQNSKFSYQGWYMNMKNRFGWRDKHETQHTGSVQLKIDGK